MQPAQNFRTSGQNTFNKATQTDDLTLHAYYTSDASANVSPFSPINEFEQVHTLIKAQDLFQAVKHPKFTAMCLSSQVEDRIALTKLWLGLKDIAEAEVNLNWLTFHSSKLSSAQRGELALCKAYTAILNYKCENEWLAQIKDALRFHLSFESQLWLLSLLFYIKNLHFIKFSGIFHNCILSEVTLSYSKFLQSLKDFWNDQPPWPEFQLPLSRLLNCTAKVYSHYHSTKLTHSQKIEIKLALLHGYSQHFMLLSNLEVNAKQSMAANLVKFTNATEKSLLSSIKQPQDSSPSFLHFLILQAQVNTNLAISHDYLSALHYCDCALELLAMANIVSPHSHHLKLELAFLKAAVFDNLSVQQLSKSNLNYSLLFIKEVHRYAQLVQAAPKLSKRITKDCSWAYFILAQRLAASGDLKRAGQYLKESLMLLRKINRYELNIVTFNNRKRLLLDCNIYDDRDYPFKFIT
jgi:hypothetical protein